MVKINQRDAGPAIFARHYRGVGTGGERGNDGRFQIIGRSKTAGRDVGLLRVSPIVVRRDHNIAAVKDGNGRVRQRTTHSKIAQCRSERADNDADGSERALDSFLGTVRVRSESDRALFVGIGPAAEVQRYLEGVEQDVVSGFDDEDPTYARRAGGAPSVPPRTATFWVASAAGSGEQTLEWDTQDGDWRAVVMNENTMRGVSAEMSIGAELDSVLWIGIGLLAAGGLLASGAALAITAGVRRRG